MHCSFGRYVFIIVNGEVTNFRSCQIHNYPNRDYAFLLDIIMIYAHRNKYMSYIKVEHHPVVSQNGFSHFVKQSSATVLRY